MKSTNSFTLIELLIVIVIIGILATALIPRLTGMQAKARDTKRIADLKQIQTALEMYANDNNGNYPSTILTGSIKRLGHCSYRGTQPTSGPTGYVPGLAPTYLSELPLDPKPTGTQNCYLYRSNTIDYILLAFRTVEGPIPPEFQRTSPVDPNERTFAIYSAGAKNR